MKRVMVKLMFVFAAVVASTTFAVATASAETHVQWSGCVDCPDGTNGAECTACNGESGTYSSSDDSCVLSGSTRAEDCGDDIPLCDQYYAHDMMYEMVDALSETMGTDLLCDTRRFSKRRVQYECAPVCTYDNVFECPRLDDTEVDVRITYTRSGPRVRVEARDEIPKFH